MSEYPTLLQFDARPVPVPPDGAIGQDRPKTEYVKTTPREWTEAEIEYIRDMRGEGYTVGEIAESLGRSETSVAIKYKRLGKRNEQYNEKHRREKYGANRGFYDIIEPQSILDAYCGTESWWAHFVPRDSVLVVTNDIDPGVLADYHRPAEKLLAELYAKDQAFDLIDLDPFGSAYNCFDLALRMARKGIIVTFGEIGHKRWKRLDFVRRYYGIENLSDFTTSRLVEEFRRIGRRHKKECVPLIVKEWPRISRVYFEIHPMKITEQWD